MNMQRNLPTDVLMRSLFEHLFELWRRADKCDRAREAIEELEHTAGAAVVEIETWERANADAVWPPKGVQECGCPEEGHVEDCAKQ